MYQRSHPPDESLPVQVVPTPSGDITLLSSEVQHPFMSSSGLNLGDYEIDSEVIDYTPSSRQARLAEQGHSPPPQVDGQPVDHSAGSGATDPSDAVYDTDVSTAETVGQSHSTFDPAEADDQRKFRRLKMRERGLWDAARNRRGQQIEGHRTRDIDHMAKIVGLTDAERQRVHTIVGRLDLQENFGSISHEAVTLAAITIACNENDRDPRPESPFADDSLTEGYEELRSVNHVSPDRIRTLRKKIRERMRNTDDEQKSVTE